MKIRRYLVALVVCCSVAAADTRVTSFSESYDSKSQEPHFHFMVAENERGLFFNLHAFFYTERQKWQFFLSGRGAGSEFSADKLTVTKGLLAPLALAEGSVVIDRQKRTITVALKVREGNAIVEFPANGTYSLEDSKAAKAPPKKPNQPPEPTR